MRLSLVRHRLATGGLLLLAWGGVAFGQSPDVRQQQSLWGGPAEFSAAPSVTYTSPDDTIRINASIGAMFLQGDEKVMIGNYTLSHLIWRTTAPVLRGSVAMDFGGGLSASLEASTAGFGDSYMEDYDWTKGDDTFANWSHRSQHPQTDLDHYFTGAASLGYELVNHDNAVIRAHAGFKYTDVQWTAYGGSFIYSSVGGFRDVSFTNPDSVAGATYRQQFPELFLGVDGEERYGNFRVGGLLRGGVTFLSVTTDNHWLTNVRFLDNLYVAPTFTAGVDVGYAIGPNAEITLAARYDHIFEQRGNTKYYNIATGAQTGGLLDVAAAGLRSAEVTAGLKGSF